MSVAPRVERWRRWPRGRSMAKIRQLGLGSSSEVLEQARHVVVLTRDRVRRRLVAVGQAAVWGERRARVAVLVPSWKEAKVIQKLLMEHFGELRRVGGSPRWESLEGLRGCDVLVVTYERFVNYLQFRARCGFYQLVLHDVHRLLRGGRLRVVEALLERVGRLQLGFRLCCTASGLPPEWVRWFQGRFPRTVSIQRGSIPNLGPQHVSVLDCSDSSLEEVVPHVVGGCCVVVPRQAKEEVSEWLAHEAAGVTVLGYGEEAAERFMWVGVDVRRGWPTPEEREMVLRLRASGGRLVLLYDGDQPETSEDRVRQRFLAPLTGGYAGWGGVRESMGEWVPEQQPVLELVLQLLRKVRYVKGLGGLFRSLFLFTQKGEAFVRECEAALARLLELNLVDRPCYTLSSGRVVRAGWLKATKEGRRLASDFASLEVPFALSDVRSVSGLLEALPELYEWLTPEDLTMLHHWAGGRKPPPLSRAALSSDRRERLGRVYRSMRFVTRIIGVAPLPEWEQVHHWPVPTAQRVEPRVSDMRAVRQLAERLYPHIICEDTRSRGLDVDPWRFFDPRELAQLEGLELGQVKRLMFGFFVKHSTTRRKTLEYWMERQWLRKEIFEQVKVISERLVKGAWRCGVGRPRTVLVRGGEGA